MLENWLKPIDISSIIPNQNLESHTFYHHIDIYDGKMPNLKDVPIVIIGLDKSADIIRKQLYQLAWHFGELNCVDLGNLRKSDDNFVIQILSELIDGNILPIIIGGKDVKAIPQFLAHKGIRKFSNVSIISENIPFSLNSEKKDFLNSLLEKYGQHILNVGLLGYQSHFTNPKILEWLGEQRYDGLRLGTLKASLEEAEPVIRDADMMFFHLDVLKGSECNGIELSSPNGITTEDACKLVHYAGMSNKLSSFSISGFLPKKDKTSLTAQLVSQIIWYFIDGFKNRKGDYPFSNADMTEYIVDLKGYSNQITFWKSNKSGRWWIQIPLNDKEDMNRHRLVPCSYKDYQLACNGEMPDRLLLAIERFI